MRGWLLVILWWLGSSGALAAQEFRVGVNDGNGEPYAFVEDGKVVRGIIMDISDAVGKALGRSVVYELLPRKRLDAALASGELDFIPIYNPDWAEAPETMAWSPPLFEERNRIVVPSLRIGTVHGPHDLDGKTLGTIRGYYYPTLEPEFRSPGGPIREDAATLAQNLQKLRLGRIDAVVDSEILIAWQFKSADAVTAGLGLAPWVVSSQKIYWAYSTRSSLPSAAIHKVFQQLKDNGTIDRILKAYQ